MEFDRISVSSFPVTIKTQLNVETCQKVDDCLNISVCFTRCILELTRSPTIRLKLTPVLSSVMT